MRYEVIISDPAALELADIAAYIELEGSPVAAERWLADIRAAIAHLGVMPKKCPAALESSLSERASGSVRQLIVGNYRVIFEVQEKEVHVLHVLHAARRPLKWDEL